MQPGRVGAGLRENNQGNRTLEKHKGCGTRNFKVAQSLAHRSRSIQNRPKDGAPGTLAF
jgi:hypothetical protein